MWGIKLKLCRIVSNNSLYKLLFFIAVSQAFWLLWQLKVSIDLQWEKWKLRFIAISLQIFWQKFCRNVCWVVLHQAYHFRPNLSVYCLPIGNRNVKFPKKYLKKINASEAIRGIKLKLCRIVYNISLYKTTVFYCHCIRTLVAIATLNFHRLIIKWKLAFIAISLQIFRGKFF